ncbi:MAG: ETC complex I subunit [Alphaproteobacteria bacterium]|nr:ETC complex I subunit [Alphaproteobacteria bacterium]MCB9931752.1 ETC complex I subunit [Alphaproteobacteria bacterium]
MKARIYCPSRTAMQQGRAKTHRWLLEFEAARALHPDPLMGWAGGGDTNRQVRLQFETAQEAEAYAKKHGIEYEVEPEKTRVVRPKSYADNFRWDR